MCRSTSIRYTRFHWLIYNLKRSRQEVTRTCIERGCVRSFHERQKQTESEMKGLILIRLLGYLLWSGFASTEKINLNFAPWGGIDVSETFLV